MKNIRGSKNDTTASEPYLRLSLTSRMSRKRGLCSDKSCSNIVC